MRGERVILQALAGISNLVLHAPPKFADLILYALLQDAWRSSSVIWALNVSTLP